MATIGLNGAKFNAAIGWFAEERVFRNSFIVDLSVSFKALQPFTDDSLNSSIDYMLLHKICDRVFAEETKLIESVAQKILDEIVATISSAEVIELTIKKLNPPVKSQIENSFVRLHYIKSDDNICSGVIRSANISL